MSTKYFKTTELASRIDEAKNKLVHLYKINGQDSAAVDLKNELKNISDEKKIRVVFIGQYTAGKSTVISALTGNKNIKIDSDIATCHTSDYSWGEVVLTDTPGLYTENPEHDARTIEMIKKSDLLIYCITSDLFNQYTLADFENWAFNVGYAGKMFLLVNKMSKEAGMYDELKESYQATLNKSLVPHSVNEFPCSFVDAKDYKDGIKENDTELIEYSHFPTFIEGLNSFVKQKGYLGKMDAPIMIMKASIDRVSQLVIEDDSHSAYNNLISRIEKKIDLKRNQFDIEARSIIKRGLKPIIEKGNQLSRKVGEVDIAENVSNIDDFISEVCVNINNQLAALCENNIAELNEEIDEVLDSDTAVYFFKSIDENYTEKKHLFEKKENKVNREKFNSIKDVVEAVSGKTISMAVKGGVSSGKFLIKSTEAAGSQLHKMVLGVGKTFGVKFKPWQAANIAKNIGNVAKFVGPAMSVVGLILDVKSTVDEENQTKKILAAQNEFRQQFIDMYSDLELRYSEELSAMFEVYDSILEKLHNNRSNVQKTINEHNEMILQLTSIRNELVSIQSEIF